MKNNLQNIINAACKEIDLAYTGDAFPNALVRHLVKDIDNELGKIKWVGDDEGWNKAVEAVRKELRTRYF